MTSSGSLLQFIRKVVREELRYVHTSLIGKVSVINDDYMLFGKESP
jgi:hypothetical protein